ncbi:hypothetical protein ACL9RF_07345 [Sphingobacterium sp. Mn56C]|uniref:hypothetical protein n=1 Tax=Sphingobacterium sp. Mn56C TaxID=3395261 RepID=UPI003BC14533
MKNVFSLGILALFLTISTASCGSGSTKKEDGKTQSDSTKTKKTKKDQPNTGCD